MSGYLIVNELNALTRRLYAEGYTRENHPDTVYWSDFQNLGYKWETLLGFTWETPCGLLIQGESDIGRGLACGEAAYQGVWYCPENDNPLLPCPYEKRTARLYLLDSRQPSVPAIRQSGNTTISKVSKRQRMSAGGG